MGCSYDVFSAKLNKTDYNKDFVDLWNTVLKDDLYDSWATADLDNFMINDNGELVFGIDSEPLFCTMENGEQIYDFLFEFLKKHPDIELFAEYECTFNNCGDMVLKYFEYKDNILKIKSFYSEAPYIEECCNCGYIDEEKDELFSLHDFVEGKELKCPKCGCIFEIDVDVDEEEFDIRKLEE